MALFNPDDKIYSCRYRIANLSFLLDKEELVVDNNMILSLSKIDNYESYIRCRLLLTIQMDIRQKIWLIKNRTNIVCKLELDKTGLDSDGETEKLGYEKCFNETFSIRLPEDDESIDPSLLEGSLQANGESSDDTDKIDKINYFESNNPVSIVLFNQELLNCSNRMVNMIPTSGLVQNIAAAILTKSKHKRVLFSKCENDTVYDEPPIPKMKAYQAILYLDQLYGLYKQGAMVYYDVDAMYIINLCANNTARREKEWSKCTFLVSDDINTIPGGAMVRKPDDDRYYINVNSSSVKFTKPSTDNNETVGSIVNVITTDDTDMESLGVEDEVISQKNELNVYIRKDDNRFFKDILKARIEENESVVVVTCDNVDMTAFAPNKRYNFTFEDAKKQKKYGKKKYRIAFAYNMIYKDALNTMQSHHVMIFKMGATSADKSK